MLDIFLATSVFRLKQGIFCEENCKLLWLWRLAVEERRRGACWTGEWEEWEE
jgi:hypothetical protein